MWVVYCWDDDWVYFGHKYFKKKERAEKFYNSVQTKYFNWEIEEIEFEDDEERLC